MADNTQDDLHKINDAQNAPQNQSAANAPLPPVEEEIIEYEDFNNNEYEYVEYQEGDELEEGDELLEVEFTPPPNAMPPNGMRMPPNMFPPNGMPMPPNGFAPNGMPMPPPPFGAPPMPPPNGEQRAMRQPQYLGSAPLPPQFIGRPPFPPFGAPRPPVFEEAENTSETANQDNAPEKKAIPPESWTTEIVYEKVYGDESADYDDAENFLDPMGDDAPAPFGEDKRKSIAEMRSKQAEDLREEGAQMALSNDKISYLHTVSLISRLAFTLLLLSVLVGGCFWLILSYYDRISERGRITKEMIEKTEQSAGIPNSGWSMPNNMVGNIMKEFYQELGDLEAVSGLSDMLIKGVIEHNGKKEEFYCLQKNGRFFVKIGEADNERVYLVGLPNEGVSLLGEGRVTGNKYDLQEKESLLIRSFVTFDEPLFMRAFANRDGIKGAYLTEIVYEGQPMFKDGISPSVSVREKDLRLQYYFDAKSKLMKACIFSNPAQTITVSYDKYSSVDGVKAPEVRTISINGKQYAVITIEFMVRNRGIMFPR